MAAIEEHRRFMQFATVGVVSTCCNLASRYAFQMAMSYEWALVGANAVGVITAFLMNRHYVFKSADERVLAELSRFVLVNLVGIAVSWATAVLLFRYALPAAGITWHADLIAHAIGIAVPVLPNYFAHRVWTFNKPSEVAPIRTE